MVYILLANGFEEAEAIVPADLLRRAGAEVALVGVTGPTAAGAHGIVVNCDRELPGEKPAGLEMLVLPGGLEGVKNIGSSPAAVSLIREAADDPACYLAAICAAPTLLGGLDLLDGFDAVCYPGLEDGLGAANVQTGRSVVTDRDVITGEGPGAAFDFGLKLVEILRGIETAQQVAHDACWHH